MAINEATKQEIKRRLDYIQELKSKNVKHTDCDWIFNSVKEMIENAVKNNVCLSDIIKCISVGTYTDHDKKLKLTSAKLATWLKANGIARKIHKRKAKKTVKKDVKNVN